MGCSNYGELSLDGREGWSIVVQVWQRGDTDSFMMDIWQRCRTDSTFVVMVWQRGGGYSFVVMVWQRSRGCTYVWQRSWGGSVYGEMCGSGEGGRCH